MKQKNFILVMLVTVLGFGSCRNSGEDTRETNSMSVDLTKEEKDSILYYDKLTNEMFDDTTNFEDFNQFAPEKLKQPYYGSIVKFKDIKECLRLYEDSMKNHGLDTLPSRDTSMTLTRMLQLTRAEVFRGREMKIFINRAARKRKGIFNGKKNLAIRVAFGIYTRKFLENRDTTRVGRIGVFLVTRKFNKGANNKWVKEDEDNDDDAFDFGGIEP